MNDAVAWKDVKRILCIRLDALGDVLMTSPAIRALKESHPAREITLLTSPAGSRIATLIPEIDAVIEYDAPWMKATGARTDSQPDHAMLARLRQAGFNAAVIFTVYSQNPLPAALLAYLADIPLRLAHCRENPYQLLTHWAPEWEPEAGTRHEVRRQLDLVEMVGSRTANEHLSLRVPAEAATAVTQLLDEYGIDRRMPWVVMHPGSTAASRRYSPRGYAQVARRLFLDFRFPVVLTGSRKEVDLVEQVHYESGVPCLPLAGRLDLPQLAALLQQAPLLISNNTGPVHIAAALGTPVVDLYALTNPQHTPWKVPHRVLNHDVPCKYCYKSVCPEVHHHCLALVTPQEVVRAALELLEETRETQQVREAL